MKYAVVPTNTKTTNSNTKPPTTASQVVIPQIKNPFGSGVSTFQGIAGRTISVLLALIVIAAVVVIIFSGFRMVMSGGNPEQLKTAKKGIIWALVGLLVAFMSFAIVSIIQRLL